MSTQKMVTLSTITIGTISLNTTVILMGMTGMGVLYVISRPRKKNRSPFFFSWTLSSMLYMYLVYQLVVVKFFQITIIENFVFVTLVACTCYLFYKMKAIADHELTGSSKGKEYSPVLTADSQYCQICQIEVNERLFHSIWWDCCVFRPNYKYFLFAQICAFATIVVGTNYGLTTACHPFMSFGSIVLPENCDHVYAQFRTALIFVTCIYGLGYLLVVILVLLHQLYNVIPKCENPLQKFVDAFDV
ncbi:palmitoyltransferase ZDHHC23 isoform X2 [Hyposmocoma kahamanoa]|uniref:palmitoyltransferase ZDHHC23 isoform X2 n=1 Tax=Hyposmocoma kahamanoa TaxID=1477025 RepID=UPI000E6D85CC|nr:palmitoyltransferase ZDHHC23 isoform X2 [Hyposmocoma kahamanoa]